MEKAAGKENGLVLTQENGDSLWRDQLRHGNSVSFRIASNSMFPQLSLDDRILVKRIPPGDQPRLGDIILFDMAGRWVVHRIVGRKKTDGQIFYRQKGDAAYRSALTPASAIAGRVLMIEHDDDRILLDKPWQKTVNRTIGYTYFMLDWTIRIGAGLFRHDQRDRDHIPAWHAVAAICIKKIQAMLARTAR